MFILKLNESTEEQNDNYVQIIFSLLFFLYEDENFVYQHLKQRPINGHWPS